MSAVRYWVKRCFLQLKKYQQGQCYTESEPVEVVEAAAYEALHDEAMKLMEWKFALQGLTPSGSEFCDVKSCEEWVRKSRTIQHEHLLAEIKIRKQLQCDLATVQGERERYKEALEKLSRLGNEPHLGNSEGNCIAQAALAQPAAPSARVAVKK